MKNQSLIDDSRFEKPAGKYSIIFRPMNLRVEVDPDRIPYSRAGRPGSILDIAVAHEPQLTLRRDCNGLCSCATCAVVIAEGLEYCNPRRNIEDELIKSDIPGAGSNHRLACQCVPNGRGDIVVEIPPPRESSQSEQVSPFR